MEKELLINGTAYLYHQQYLKEDGIWECVFSDAQGNVAEGASSLLAGCDEQLEQARRELRERIRENELKPGIDNAVVVWRQLDAETQRRIRVFSKKIKAEETGTWHSSDEDYRNWRNRMHAHTGMWFTKSQYDKL